VSNWRLTDEEMAEARGMTLEEFKRWQEIKCRPAIRLDNKGEYAGTTNAYENATGYGIKWGSEE